MEEPPPSRKFAPQRCCRFHWRGKMIVIIPILTSPILILAFIDDRAELKCLYLLVTMSLLWITEVIPIYVTSLLPIMFLPLFGLVPPEVVCGKYFSETVVMFLGGMMAAMAIEYCNLHRRLALRVIRLIGGSPRRLLAGVILVTVFAGLWISNSACTAMMCPIVKALIDEMDKNNVFQVYMTQEEEPMGEGEPPHLSRMAMVFYFGIAYCSAIGGLGTLIGTGTNLVFRGIYNARFPNADQEITFTNFMLYSFPIVCLVNACCVYFSFLITHMGLFRPNSKTGQAIKQANANRPVVEAVIKQTYKDLGPMTSHEIQVALMFGLMIILLVTRRPGFFPGWDTHVNAKHVGGCVPVLFVLLLLFAIPTQYAFFKYCCGKAPFPAQRLDSLLSWRSLHEMIPWGLVFLLGGGFALAEASSRSGLNKMVAESLKVFGGLPPFAVQMLVILLAILFSLFNSSVVVANILIPILCEMALVVKIHPLALVLPCNLAISICFFLPVSTPPNAMICQYAHIKTKYMAVAGIVPTIIGYWLIVLNANTYGHLVFPGLGEFPKWAEEAAKESKIL